MKKPRPSKLIVLNVDDTEAMRYAKSRSLTAAGYTVLEAGTGREALDLMASERPPLVLLDIKLPDMSGIEVCEVIKREFPETLVMQISATYRNAVDRVRGLESGADAYLVQPVTPDELAAGVAALLRTRTAERSLRRLNDDLSAQLAAGVEALRLETMERERVEAALQQSQKLEALGHLTGGIAHDFNNLLMAIIGNLDILQRRLDAGRTDVTRQSRNAVEAANRAAALTQRLLSFARQEPQKTETIRVGEVLAGMRSMLTASLDGRTSIEVDAPGDLWAIACDNYQLENAVLNVVINARDAMPAGGIIRLAARNTRVREADALEIPGCAPGDYVRLEVADEGVGMSPEVLEHALEPFFTTKPRGQGTGLGLSMLYSFMRQSDGALDIKSQEGAGTKVSLYFPRVRPGERPKPAADSAEIGQGAGERILLIEDEALVRDMLVETLTERGYACLVAASAPEGLAFADQVATIDLVVTDIGLSGPIDGREVVRRLRSLRPSLKALFISGHTVDGAASEIPGLQDFLMKPFDLDALVRKVQALVAASL